MHRQQRAKRVAVWVQTTKGVKVYPGSNDKFHTAATNVSQVIASGKMNTYHARDAVTWYVQKGA